MEWVRGWAYELHWACDHTGIRSRIRVRGAEGREVTPYFDREGAALRMVDRMRATAPEGEDNWALITQTASSLTPSSQLFAASVMSPAATFVASARWALLAGPTHHIA